MWPYLDIDPHRGNQIKTRSLRWALKQCDWCPYKKEDFGHRDTHTRRRCENTGRAPPTSWGLPEARSWERGREQILPHSPPKAPTLPVPLVVPKRQSVLLSGIKDPLWFGPSSLFNLNFHDFPTQASGQSILPSAMCPCWSPIWTAAPHLCLGHSHSLLSPTLFSLPSKSFTFLKL